MKRYAFDATRGEMFEIAHGAFYRVEEADAEVERLRAALKESADEADSDLKVIQLAQAIIGAHNVNVARLATAKALIDRVKAWLEVPGRDEGEPMFEELRAILAGPPASEDREPAAPTRTREVDAEPTCPCGWCVKRAEADQHVLDAMARVPEDTLRRSLANTLHGPEHSRDVAKAELARRGLRP